MNRYSRNEAAIAELNAEQYRVTQQNGTEYPGTGEYMPNHAPGISVDIVSGKLLSASSDKLEFGCGWPSFTKPMISSHLLKLNNMMNNMSHGMIRAEVHSAHGDSHPGHVFPDDPQGRGGLRCCIDSASLRFIALERMATEGYAEYIDQVEVK